MANVKRGTAARSAAIVAYAQRYSKHAAATRQQHALGQELADESPSSRAESGADGDLALPHGPARQREIGEIRAADQQHHAHRRKQHV